MKIAIDLDGVLGDVVSHILPTLNEKYGTNYVFNDINQWDFPVNGQSIGKHLRQSFADPVFLLTVPVVAGAKEALDRLSRKHEIKIVTGRPNYSRRYTYLWLNDMGFKFNDIIFATTKTVKTTKGCDILIDDYHKYLNEFRSSGGKSIQFVRPWNSSLIFETSASGWEEIPDVIDS